MRISFLLLPLVIWNRMERWKTTTTADTDEGWIGEYYGFVTFDHLKPAVVNSWMWQSCTQKDQQDSEKSWVQERERSEERGGGVKINREGKEGGIWESGK